VNRLYHRIVLTLLVFVVLALALASLAGHLLLAEVVRFHLGGHLESRALALGRELPPADRPDGEVQRALERLAPALQIQAAVWSRDGRRVAFTSTDLPAPAGAMGTLRWLPAPLAPALAVELPDGRQVVVQPRRFPRPAGFLLVVATLAALLAAASYPVARLVTRRLEKLEAGVRRLGEGDLASRVEVGGDDELGSLATSFNRAAERLQSLVEAQRRVLASASHELRSPLTRARMALELARDDSAACEVRIDEAVSELEELDILIEELMVAGRLELQPAAPASLEVDVAALLAEEGRRVGATVVTRPAALCSDPRLLKVLLRNLLENARRHGLGAEVEAGCEPLAEGGRAVRIWVADRGPGVPENERERIFEPFYRPVGHAEGLDGGVGLGLYLVRRIAISHGGDAVCRARDGGGTLFEVTLREPPAVRPPGQ
jgi:signal transduction histidine kinase